MIKVIISGVNGRMGKAVEALCKADENVEIVGGIDINLGIPHEFPTADDAFALETRADVVIDFSHHSCAAALCDYAAKTGTPVVFATTGYTPEESEIIQKTSEKVALFTSANMSVGVNLLIELSKKAAAILESFDVEIIEKHHNKKLDAPSGTALMLADGIKSVRPDLEYVYDRTGRRAARSANELGISSVRGGTIVGEHDVIFAGTDEVVTLSHNALSREIFAHGALCAAKFLVGKAPGLYHMPDMLALGN